MDAKDKSKKQVLLRLSSSLWKELAAWAEDDFRSINGQIEFLLTESVRSRRRHLQEHEEDNA
ncbi:MAG: Arc family DNA-binding protein [Sphaerochaeta sp.]